jgi:KDO2-lipid IV(A) lauroyltransferase
MLELTRTGLETGKIWYASDRLFESLCLTVTGQEILFDESNPAGVLVLTPPMGNREVIMRYLANQYDAIEYYHPNSRLALDELIQSQRQRIGITLVEHNDAGRSEIIKILATGRLALLCPDQQPRLRGGIFAPFFGVSALTMLAIPELQKQSRANMVFAYATREKEGFNLHFERCEFNSDLSELDLLTAVNIQLEEIIAKAPAQYRWSDKRFNIRPLGAAKVYRW